MAHTYKLDTLDAVEDLATSTKLLLVGPKDAHMGGAKATFTVFLEELSSRDYLAIDLISSGAPPDVYNNKYRLINRETVRRTFHVIRAYLARIAAADIVFVFSNNAFTIALVPILLIVAKLFGKPFFHKPIGGDLDTDLQTQNPLIRRYVVWMLNKADGIFAQTNLLKANLQKLGFSNVRYLPGCRPKPTMRQSSSTSQQGTELRLLFLSQIKKEKGPFYLLEALRKLSDDGHCGISCDFYGPIFDEDRERFYEDLDATPLARYCGVVAVGQAIPKIREYDVLVLPTYYACEGHPGVIIEAMLAGVPIISTEHRSIPELIEHGTNGLLIPLHDVNALVSAIDYLSHRKDLVAEMGLQSENLSRQFQADVVVSEAVRMLMQGKK